MAQHECSSDNNESKKGYTLRDQQLMMVVAKHGKKESHMLVFEGHRFGMNNNNGNIKYWNCCRQAGKRRRSDKNHRRGDKNHRGRGERCRARVRTSIQPNGLYSIIVSQPKHSHLPADQIHGEYKYILGKDPNEHTKQ